MTTAPEALAELTAIPQWVCWRYETRNGKPTKCPIDARTRAYADVTKAATWCVYPVAAAAAPDFDGVGLVITGLEYVGVDLDHSLDTDARLEPWARAIVDRLQSYTEVTPSGTGVRVWLRGRLPDGGRKRGGFGPDGRGVVEMYDTGRFFTVTGDHFADTPTTIAERAEAVRALHAEIFPASPRTGTVRPSEPVDLDDAALIERAQGAANGAKFSALWRGDIVGYHSHSEADLALASLLCFWTGRDAGRMDTLFRASGLMRSKWDERHGAGTYGERTIATALAQCGEVYTMGRRRAADSDSGKPRPGPSNEVDSARADSTIVQPYRFVVAFPPGHFVSGFIAYASARTDAALEYHEAAGLVLLAGATPNVRAELAQCADGLPTNLYALLIGDSTKSRKSTAKNIARDLHQRVIPDGLLADQASPEAFIEQLAGRSDDSSTWYQDEMGETIEKLHHAKYLAGLRGLLLQAYEGGAYRYQRTTKRSKAGAPIRDSLLIERMHLSILGAATPAIFDTLTGRDVESGFLGRFSIIMPAGKPPRRPFFALGEALGTERNILAKSLHALYVWAKTAPRRVEFSPGTLERLDDFAAALEDAAEQADDRAKAMLQRLSAMAVKVAVLAAAGRPETPEQERLLVTAADADSALAVAQRWQEYAVAFAARIGENEFEKAVARCLRHARQLATRQGARVSRRQIAKNAHLSKRELDDVQATLVDRGYIRVESEASQSGPDAVLWRISD